MELLDAAEATPYEDLREEHVSDYRALFGRMHLDLGPSPASRSSLPTPERVAAYSTDWDKQVTPNDSELEALLYHYARYLMISSSRGGLPANLQGLWLIGRNPAWRCDYHTDVNIQMNYWFTDASNLAECFEPLARWVDAIREVRTEETRRVLGADRGWLMRSENGIFGGSTWYIQKGDSAWLCQNLWDHYTYTRDREYLERYAYPVMKEISEFRVDHLKEVPDPDSPSEPDAQYSLLPTGDRPSTVRLGWTESRTTRFCAGTCSRTRSRRRLIWAWTRSSVPN